MNINKMTEQDLQTFFKENIEIKEPILSKNWAFIEAMGKHSLQSTGFVILSAENLYFALCTQYQIKDKIKTYTIPLSQLKLVKVKKAFLSKGTVYSLMADGTYFNVKISTTKYKNVDLTNDHEILKKELGKAKYQL